MQGHGDQQAEDLLERAVAAAPRDILELLAALRDGLGDALDGREGVVHVFVQRLVRAGRLHVGGRTDAGLTRYHAASADAVAGSGADVAPGAAADPTEPAARILARSVRDPADRLRIASDVAAHVASLGEDSRAFGRPKALRTLLQRADRGKRTVVLAADGHDLLVRFLWHEGPWILGAVVVFFVLKTFIVAPFKIPSASMVPTLREGDRVVVFTIAHSGVPDRHDVIVYERDGTNYVKRLVALPGEEVALWHGDVYIDGALLVRPDWLVEALRSRVGDWGFGGDEVPAGFASMREDGMEHWWWRSGRFDAHPRPGIHFGMHDGFAVLEGARAAGERVELILAHGPAGTRAASRGFVLQMDDDGVRLLAREGLDLTAGRPGEAERVLAEVPDAPTGPIRLALAYVDGRVRARAGDLHVDEPAPHPGGDLTVGLGRSVGATGTLRLVLDRDHHYGTPREATHGTPVAGERRAHRVPEGHVFCLGDNTTNSRDSRFSAVGDIPVEAIVGPVSLRIWPPSRVGVVR